MLNCSRFVVTEFLSQSGFCVCVGHICPQAATHRDRKTVWNYFLPFPSNSDLNIKMYKTITDIIKHLQCMENEHEHELMGKYSFLALNCTVTVF